MTYKHTREIDTFYEISQTGALQLPRSVSTGLQLNPNARHKAKVRITTNEKTGEELAKIVKTRVADIDVYSPRTLFDWRVSVNVEMDFDVDVRDLVAVEKRDGRADRRKDRVSYKHLQYQIDLTQVTPAEVGAFISKHYTSRWWLANIPPASQQNRQRTRTRNRSLERRNPPPGSFGPQQPTERLRRSHQGLRGQRAFAGEVLQGVAWAGTANFAGTLVFVDGF